MNAGQHFYKDFGMVQVIEFLFKVYVTCETLWQNTQLVF